MAKTYGSTYTTEPISFKLLNSKKEDITYQIHFENRDSVESAVSSKIDALPNSIKESSDRLREEQHGWVQSMTPAAYIYLQ